MSQQTVDVLKSVSIGKKKIGFAVIGCGKMGERRINSITQHPEATLICIADNDEKNAENLANRAKCMYYTDFEKAIEQSDVDCVVVSTPNKYHASVSLKALESGKHVFCEKPLAVNPKDALTMVETAIRNNVFLKTGSNLRFFPSVQKARELLDHNAIGEQFFLRGWIGNSGKHLQDSWYSDPEVIGGGTLLDNGSHLLDLTRWVLGEIAECMGYVTTAFWPISPLEDNGFGILKTLDGKLAFVQSSWTEWADYMYMEIYGTEGYIRINNRDQCCTTILGKRNGARYIFDYSLQPSQSYQLEFHSFLQAIKEGRQPQPSGFDGLRAVQMVHGLYESSRTGHAIKIYGETEERLKQIINGQK